MTDSSPFAGPLPVIGTPVATEPFPALDFLPVDDAFALELRAESIEQLVGGDSLRRGESEHIEAGRSEANADLVAGRDRVHVHGHLHEHTGRGLAEQAAHLETAVGGTLEVHARHEDQVLFAGHMLDAWDGGGAIAAAMSDDTVGGGGVRTTVPLDLWVHALMGVEERIGTCTADAVLAELAATHYEREYASGVHRAALAVLQGTLYQTTRSQFVPLMKLSTGVRNLIAGGGDGGGGNAPATSPPPAPPPGEGAAPGEAAAGTLAAGRTATETPVHGLRAAEGLADARRVSLEDVEGSIDLRAADELGETGEAMHADDLGALTRPPRHRRAARGAEGDAARHRTGDAGRDHRRIANLRRRRHRLGARGQRHRHRVRHSPRSDHIGVERPFAAPGRSEAAAAGGEARAPRGRRSPTPIGGGTVRLRRRVPQAARRRGRPRSPLQTGCCSRSRQTRGCHRQEGDVLVQEIRRKQKKPAKASRRTIRCGTGLPRPP